MANGPRSIYSRRQRMAPGQYDNPLADFLDRLPDYFNDYQRNQLALERQQLADRRYEDSKELARQQAEEEQDRYNKRQTRLDAEIVRDEKNEKRKIASSFMSQGQYEPALQIFKNLGDVDNVARIQSIQESTDGRADRFAEIRAKAGRSDTNHFQHKSELKRFREDFKIRPGDNSDLDGQLFRLEQLNTQKVNRQNQGMIPLEEWKTLNDPEARADYNAVKDAEKAISELREEQAKGVGAISSGIGGPSIGSRIENQKNKISQIMSKPKYKLETEAEYNFRTKSETRSQLGLSQPNINMGENTFNIDEFTPSSEESLADMDVNEAVEKLIAPPESQPDSVQVESRTPIQDILNIPSAQAQPQTTEQDTTEPADLQLGETISAQPTSNFDVKDISEIKNKMLKNPQTARKYAKDIEKLKNLINEMSTLSQLKDERSRNFRKKQLDEGVEAISNKIKKQYGDFINPNTGEFSSEDFSNDFFSVLSLESDTPQDQLKQLFKGFSTAKPVQQAI